jgi:hypothetical protein
MLEESIRHALCDSDRWRPADHDMGQHDRSEALFYYFRLEDQVPENHLLRLIDKHISFEFVRGRPAEPGTECFPSPKRETEPSYLALAGHPVARNPAVCHFFVTCRQGKNCSASRNWLS